MGWSGVRWILSLGPSITAWSRQVKRTHQRLYRLTTTPPHHRQGLHGQAVIFAGVEDRGRTGFQGGVDGEDAQGDTVGYVETKGTIAQLSLNSISEVSST